ncbi:TonB-dependent receptor [Vibrio ulleungensis]|nr:TonB-dependent receptor [Vibrio ulleungensis]
MKHNRAIFLLAMTATLPSAAFAEGFELPIWKSDAEALGYVLPEAFGISIGYMHVEQGINVDSISFDGLKFLGRPLPEDLIGITTKDSFQKSDVLTLRADMWLFPFLNFYAIGGKIKGYTQTTIDVAIDIPILKPEINDLPFKLDLDGNMYGGGIVLAGGHGNWFTLVDASFTKTNLTVIDGGIDSFVATPRVGYDFTNHGTPIRAWIGAQYQDIQQSLSGNISDLDLPSELANLIDLVNTDEEGRFNVEQSLATDWSPVAGFQYTFNKTFNVIGEFSFGERQSVFVTLDTRF